MEKNTPSCPLPRVKRLVLAGKMRSTATARMGAASLGFDHAGMIAEILRLTMKEFYKSMTTYADAHVWQDVYRHGSCKGMLYVKLTVMEDVLVVSFKEL